MFDPLLPSIQPMYPRLTNALTACEQALQPSFQPVDFVMACQKLGNLLQGMGRFEDAALWHTQALSPQPDFAQVYAGVGRAYILQRKWQAAAIAYQKVLSYNSNSAEAYWRLGAIALHQDQREQALHYWYHALALDPKKSTVEGHIRLGHAFRKLGEIAHALACYRRAIRLNISRSDGYHFLTQVLIEQGRFDDAIATCRQATEQLEQPSWAFYQWGALLRQQGHVDDALAMFSQAMTHDPEYPWSRHDTVEILLAQRQWQKAIAQSHATLAVQPFPWAYSQLGQALIAEGQREEAIACYQAASDLRGWHLCKQRDYQFTQDWFTHNIPFWQTLLQELMGVAYVNALEVGSFQGMSACWLLDNVLTDSTAHLTCIDPGVQPEFHINLAKTGVANKVTHIADSSHQVLPTLANEAYDFIYIDGCHLASHVHKDGLLAWPLLKPRGFLIFDDYLWTDPQYPGQDPKLGIDQFLDTMRHQMQVVHHEYQVIAKKVSPTSC